MKDEISVSPDGIIMRGVRIFIPKTLRRKALTLAHESHQGIEKTKAQVREKIVSTYRP